MDVSLNAISGSGNFIGSRWKHLIATLLLDKVCPSCHAGGSSYKEPIMNEDRRHLFRDAHQDRESVKGIPDTPQTRSPSYNLAFADADFLCRD